MSKTPVSNDELQKARKKMVYRAAELINETSFSLSPIENKALSFMISNISPTDPPDRLYTFDVATFTKAIMWGSDTSHQRVRAMIKSLADKSVWFHDVDKNEFKLVRWLDTFIMDEKTGKVCYSFHSGIAPYLFDQETESNFLFIGYEFEKTCVMQGMYSDRLYSIFKTYALEHDSWTFLLEDLKAMLVNPQKSKKSEIDKTIKKWENYAIFYRNVLEKSIEEINTYTDLKVAVKPLKEDLQGKKYRKYVALEVTFTKKNDTEINEADAIIEDLYRKSQPEYYQLSFSDLIPNYVDNTAEVPSGKSDEIIDLPEADYAIVETIPTGEDGKPVSREEAKKRITARLEDRNKKLNELHVKYGNTISDSEIFAIYILKEQYGNDFTDKEYLNMLVEAEKHVDIMRIREKDIAAWSIDYIKYYRDKILSSDIPTKHTEYGRLMDQLRRDHDNIKEKESGLYDLHL